MTGFVNIRGMAAAPLSTRLRTSLGRQFSSLGEYNFRVFFIGQVISLIGTWMQAVGVAWLVLEITGSSVAMGVVTALQFLPMMLFALVGGVMADRLPKRRTLLVVQSVALCQAGLLAILTLTDLVELWQVMTLAFIGGLCSAVERPVRQSFYVELVGRERLPNAVALHSTILNGSRVIGPAVAGLLIALTDVSATFVFNSASYIAVLIGYGLMRPAAFRDGGGRAESGSVLAMIGEGLRYAVRTPAAAFPLILIAFIGTFGYNFNVVVPLVAKFVLDAGPGQFGLLTSALGLGSFGAALAQTGAGPRSPTFLLTTSAAFSVFFATLAFSDWYLASALALAATGIAGTLLMTSANTTLQLEAPPHLRGRVVSIYLLLMAGSTPIGGLLTGVLSEAMGVRGAIAVEAAGCGLGVVVAYAYRRAHADTFTLPPREPDERLVPSAANQ